MHRAGLLVGLGRAAPHHDEAFALVGHPEVLDVGDEGLSLVPLAGLGLDPGALEFFDPALVEHGVHGDDALKFGRNGGEVGIFEYATGSGGLQHVGRDGVPAAEDDVVQFGQGREFADEGVAVALPVAETDVGHLADRSDRGRQASTGGDDTCDEGGGHSAHSRGQDPEAAGSGCDVERFVHGEEA